MFATEKTQLSITDSLSPDPDLRSLHIQTSTNRLRVKTSTTRDVSYDFDSIHRGKMEQYYSPMDDTKKRRIHKKTVVAI